MTRTAIQRMELDETARHNREVEKANIYNAIAGAVGASGSVLRGYDSIHKGQSGIPQSDTRYNINYNINSRGRRSR